MASLSQHIIIVTGKGGVGKSTIAASLAYKASREGKRVLLVELGEESTFSYLLGMSNVSYTPQTVPTLGFQVAKWDTESCLREYVLHYIKIQSLFKIFFDNKVMRTFINVAPALKELAILGKLTSGERHVGPQFDYDVVVVDGYATGHMLALLRAPKGISETIKTGPMGHHSSQILRVLTDPKITQYVLVSLPDELPVVETLELEKSFEDEFKIKPRIILNRYLVPPFPIQEMESAISEPGPESEFVQYLKTVVGRHKKNKVRLEESGLPVVAVPLMYKSEPGVDMVKDIASELLV